MKKKTAQSLVSKPSTVLPRLRFLLPFNPRKYRYAQYFDDLPGDVNAIVVIVLCGVTCDDRGHTRPNNYVVTAFFKHIRPKR